MVSIGYNNDVLFLILKELQNDSFALFTCLMVNKLWCDIAIPILWRNPWQYSINYSNKKYLFNIIYSYLPKDIKNSLLLPPSQPPLFNYLSFCKSINIKVINDIVSNGPYDQLLLQQEFCRLLIRQCSRLEYLNMLSIDHQIFYISTPLESLSELICDSSTCSSYFYELAQTCQNIQRFIVINAIVSVNDGIIKLIEVQKNLKYFEWKDNFEEVVDNFMDMDDPYYNEMLLTLVKKSDMIDHLILLFHYDGHKLFEILSKFSKLKTLTLNKYCLKDTIIPMYYDLETLKVDHITINAAVNLITNSGGKLKEVLFKYNGYYNNEYSVETYAKETLNLIHKTYKCCSLVEILSLIFPLTTDHFIEFENLLKNCHNLKKLTLIIDDINIDGNDYERSSENVKKLLQILVKSAPIGLKEIKIFNDFIPYLESLKILEKWRDQNIIICLGVLKDFHF